MLVVYLQLTQFVIQLVKHGSINKLYVTESVRNTNLQLLKFSLYFLFPLYFCHQFIGCGITWKAHRDGRVEKAGRKSATEIYNSQGGTCCC